MYIKDRSKPNFTLFLNWLLRKFMFLIPMVNFAPPPPRFIRHVSLMVTELAIWKPVFILRMKVTSMLTELGFLMIIVDTLSFYKKWHPEFYESNNQSIFSIAQIYKNWCPPRKLSLLSHSQPQARRLAFCSYTGYNWFP